MCFLVLVCFRIVLGFASVFQRTFGLNCDPNCFRLVLLCFRLLYRLFQVVYVVQVY